MSSGDDSSRSHALLLLDVSRKGAAEAHERCAQYDGYGHGGHAAVGAWPAGLRVESDACAENKECEDQVALPCSPDRNDSEDEELSCLLACFDLSMRFSRIPPYRWAQEAKEKAAEIRHGEYPSIVWWTSAGLAHKYRMRSLPLSPTTGVFEFRVDARICEVWRQYLLQAESYDENHYLQLAGDKWPGYGNYPYVHAPLGVVPGLQEKKTARVHGQRHVNKILREEPMMWELVQEVRRVLKLPMPTGKVLQPSGKSILALHVLCQDKTQQASFSWHDDSHDIKEQSRGRSDMTTVIVSLSHDESGMRIWGMQPPC